MHSLFSKCITLLSILVLFCLTGCKPDSNYSESNKASGSTVNIVTENYELTLPPKSIGSALVLFGGYPETPADIKREFPILQLAKEKGIAVILMKFNQHLWLEEDEKKMLTETLNEAFDSHKIPKNKVYIGGFSSGGNVSLLLANHMFKKNAEIKPKGVFIVDSPVDLRELYNCAKRNLDRSDVEISLRESQGIIARMDQHFGVDEASKLKYEKYSPYLSQNHSISNLIDLKDVRIRLYTEPDSVWWKDHRQNDYIDMNAYYIKLLSEDLKSKFGSNHIELIETQNKGFRANGDKHPHSWSIVNRSDLLEWILD